MFGLPLLGTSNNVTAITTTVNEYAAVHGFDLGSHIKGEVSVETGGSFLGIWRHHDYIGIMRTIKVSI